MSLCALRKTATMYYMQNGYPMLYVELTFCVIRETTTMCYT